uniref:AlNc14C27G2621 protein n=1 Tax=Albugo laibachii Nc14 TaxID=890382 RepID=F0W6Y7_9STRA|nr:AlNc14C27G2621 [Albugo laibachii Nc14]|eukprot:CCA16882.1 AlNc14C27G2621 [Albugo laibachii Nc14]
MERVAAETMSELWLSIISEEDESKSSKAVLASNGAATSSTRNHRQSGHMLFLHRTNGPSDSQNAKHSEQECTSKICFGERKDADDERTDWNLHEFIRLQSEEDIPINAEYRMPAYVLNCPMGTGVATGRSCVTNGHRLEAEACHPPYLLCLWLNLLKIGGVGVSARP